MRRSLVFGCGFGIPLLLVGAVVVSAQYASSATSFRASARQHALQHQHARLIQGHVPAPKAPSSSPGVLAIHPARSANANGAAFTADDVRRFLSASVSQFFPTTDGSTPHIAKILFITAGEASALMHGESIGRSATSLMCYVEIHGNLNQAEMIHSPVTDFPGPAPAHAGQMVFDASTGNLLVSGFYD